MRQLLTAILFIVLLPLSVIAKDFGALILYDHSEVKFFPDGRKIWREEKAVKILDKRGIRTLERLSFPSQQNTRS